MSAEVAKPLQLKRRAGKPLPPIEPAKPQQRITTNAILGMGMWTLLWLGYNTDFARAEVPGFPNNTVDLIHGVRAFFPMFAGWFALLLIFARSKRAFSWIMGPIGLILLYAITGLVSSATISPAPAFALYYGANYLAIALVVMAIVLVKDPLPDLLKVLKLTWIVSSVLTISLLAAMPVIGAATLTEPDTPAIGLHTYNGAGTIMGMASTRNTGFARYAGISALATLPWLMKKGTLALRVVCGIVFTLSLYSEFIANGRTEILAFIPAVAIILGQEKTKRTVNLMAGTAALILLGFKGFYSGFYLYFTRTGKFDPTLTGRTATWGLAWDFLWKSPWVGYGFQADRYFLGQHMHNAFLHVLFQSGLLGGLAILLGLGIVWYYTIYYFFLHQPADKSLIPPEIPAILLFVTISSVTESTFAYFSAAWLLSAPIVGYVMALHRRMKGISLQAAQERTQRIRLARRNSRVSGSPLEVPPSTSGGAIPA